MKRLRSGPMDSRVPVFTPAARSQAMYRSVNVSRRAGKDFTTKRCRSSCTAFCRAPRSSGSATRSLLKAMAEVSSMGGSRKSADSATRTASASASSPSPPAAAPKSPRAWASSTAWSSEHLLAAPVAAQASRCRRKSSLRNLRLAKAPVIMARPLQVRSWLPCAAREMALRTGGWQTWLRAKLCASTARSLCFMSEIRRLSVGAIEMTIASSRQRAAPKAQQAVANCLALMAGAMSPIAVAARSQKASLETSSFTASQSVSATSGADMSSNEYS
mmetsp:Transcript_104281/g.331622  ORF Transcript_104281/g.331622 Transcript_104281/m.331622 type:complete len:274 (+) Transcript_104281:1440-2261(+)